MQVPRPIAVCGMYRSGTSLTANLVHAWGAFGGEARELVSGDETNPRGFWQHPKLGSFMSALKRDVTIGFWDPAFAAAVRAKASDPRHRRAAEALLGEMQSSGRPWFWKDPLLSVWLPFWKELWRDALYVITVRHPYASALSWQKYSLPPEAHGKVRILAAALLQWQALMTSVIEHTEGEPTHFVVYEELCAHPHRECRRLAEFLSRECGGGTPTDAQLSAMVATIEPQLATASAEVAFDDVDVATDAQRALYRFLLAKAGDPRLPFDTDLYAIHPGAAEYLDNLLVLTAIYRQLVRLQRGQEAAAMAPS